MGDEGPGIRYAGCLNGRVALTRPPDRPNRSRFCCRIYRQTGADDFVCALHSSRSIPACRDWSPQAELKAHNAPFSPNRGSDGSSTKRIAAGRSACP